MQPQRKTTRCMMDYNGSLLSFVREFVFNFHYKILTRIFQFQRAPRTQTTSMTVHFLNSKFKEKLILKSIFY